MIDQRELNKIRQETDIAVKEGWDSTKIEWRKAALTVIYSLCTQEVTITANDFTETIKAMPLKTHDNRAIGGVVRIAQKFKWIVKTGETEISKAGHLSNIQIWKSLLFGKVVEEKRNEADKLEWQRSNRAFISLGDGNYVVNGAKGKRYSVLITGNTKKCECEAFRYSGFKDCKHIKMIIDSQKRREEKRVEREIEKSRVPML